jgi:hypothetical protein
MTGKIFKTAMIAVAAMFIAGTVNAQTWKGVVMHNGYYCYSLKTANNITVYSALGVSQIFIKISVPFKWDDETRVGYVQYFVENLLTGECDTQSTTFSYHNGWLYFGEYLFDWCGNYPCNNYTITLYENNDAGRNVGRKVVVNLYLNNLNTSQMVMNKQAFETYW